MAHIDKNGTYIWHDWIRNEDGVLTDSDFRRFTIVWQKNNRAKGWCLLDRGVKVGAVNSNMIVIIDRAEEIVNREQAQYYQENN